MNATTGTYRDGAIVLDTPVDWPEGARVTIIADGPRACASGLVEADWSDSLDARAERLKRIDAIEPLVLTEQDEAEIKAARDGVRRTSIEAVRRQMGLLP